MRVCPKCGYVDPQYWRRSFQRNAGGEIDICHINDLEQYEPELAKKVKTNRGFTIEIPPYAYLLGKRAVYVKRVWLELYKVGGYSAFSIPYESKAKLSKQIGKTQKSQTRLLVKPTKNKKQ